MEPEKWYDLYYRELGMEGVWRLGKTFPQSYGSQRALEEIWAKLKRQAPVLVMLSSPVEKSNAVLEAAYQKGMKNPLLEDQIMLTFHWTVN